MAAEQTNVEEIVKKDEAAVEEKAVDGEYGSGENATGQKLAGGPFQGTWKHLRSENFEGFLQENGVPFLLRKMVAFASPTVVIEQEGDHFSIKTSTLMTTHDLKFTVGETTELVWHEGSKVKLMSHWDDAKLVTVVEALETEANKTFKKQTITRELLNSDELLLTMDNGAVAKRWFKRQPTP